MTDTTGPTVEMMNSAAPPHLSEEGIAYYRSLLDDPQWVASNPANASALKSSFEAALAATGQDQGPPADQRTLAQRLHDQQHGVSFGASGEVVLPNDLNTSIQRDASGDAPDPKVVAGQLEAAGLDPDQVLSDARFALEQARKPVALERLGSHALAQLALFGAHLQKHQATRPGA